MKGITLYVPFSREWAIDTFFKSLDQVIMPRSHIDAFLLIDSKDRNMLSRVRQKAYLMGFRSCKFHLTERDPLPEDSPILVRRQRIVDNWEIVQENVNDNEYFFGVEDDTLCPADSFVRLYSSFITANDRVMRDATGLPEVVFIQGIQKYRQANAVGAWRIDDEAGIAMTLPYSEGGLVEMDGGGFYCFLTKTKYIKNHTFKHSDPLFASDVDFVYSISTAQKKLALTSWDIKCGHLLKDGTMLYPCRDMDYLRYKRINGEWTKDERETS